jgi:transcriptional regulator with XRE-family HTH domain
MNYGKAIRVTRALADISQRGLAKVLDTDPSYISLLEANKREPSREVLERIAAALNIPLHLLILLATDENDTGSTHKRRLSDIAEALANLLFTEDDNGHGRSRSHTSTIRKSEKARAKAGKQPSATLRNGRKRSILL